MILKTKEANRKFIEMDVKENGTFNILNHQSEYEAFMKALLHIVSLFVCLHCTVCHCNILFRRKKGILQLHKSIDSIPTHKYMRNIENYIKQLC